MGMEVVPLPPPAVEAQIQIARNDARLSGLLEIPARAVARRLDIVAGGRAPSGLDGIMAVVEQAEAGGWRC